MENDERADRGRVIGTGNAPWWQRAVVLHVYPRSFQDGDGDGVGDLPGITRRLPYLVDLGVDALWLSPFHPSPMVDFGYDVTDHCDVDPLFGTLADADALIARAHDLGLRVIVDFVPNHTSDRHPWFLESRSSRTSAKRDWYVWRDPGSDGGPPTNWRSEFGGPAWTFDDATGQWYHHAYLPEQPNLNWHHPEVREAMHDVIRFWAERGVDGFRLDAYRRLFVDQEFRDEPPNPAYRPGLDPEVASLLPWSTCEQPELFEHAADLREFVTSFGDPVLLGEVYVEPDVLARFHGTADRPGLHLAGNFNLFWTEWTAEAVADLVRRYEAALPEHAWPNWVLGNHDRSRIASRLGAAQSRVAAVFLLTSRGTPTMYAGDELGIEDVVVPPEQVQDPWERREPGRGLGRDPARTPMQWDASPGAGFTTSTPWLPLTPDAVTRNVAVQRADPRSTWTLYHRLLELRRREDALSIGDVEEVTGRDGVLSYVRSSGGRRLRIVADLAGTGAEVTGVHGRVLVSTHLDRDDAVVDVLRLRPDEAVVVAPDPA